MHGLKKPDPLNCRITTRWNGRTTIFLFVIVEDVKDIVQNDRKYCSQKDTPLTDGPIPDEKFSAVRRVSESPHDDCSGVA